MCVLFFFLCFFFLLSYCVYMGAAPWWAWGWLGLDVVFIPCLDIVDTWCAGCTLVLALLYVCTCTHAYVCMYVFMCVDRM